MPDRRPVDIEEYVRRSRAGPCFICALVRGEPVHPQEIVYEDDLAIAFLSLFQVLRGYTLVAPRQHREHVTADFSPDEYLQLQRVVYLVGDAVRRAVPTERLYVLSLGSQEGNGHVHWHLAPLPPGVPYEEQQLEALRLESGVFDLSGAELSDLAETIRAEIAADAR
ncbi:MAG: HIT family protein [Gaiellaceae bacterium]